MFLLYANAKHMFEDIVNDTLIVVIILLILLFVVLCGFNIILQNENGVILLCVCTGGEHE